MRSWIILCGLTAIATAHPLAQSSSVFANTKPPAGWADFLGKIDMSHTTESAMEGPCPDIMLVVARGSGEPGTIGVTTGPMLCKSLKEKYGSKFGCQGIGGAYSAGMLDNVSPKGTSDASIKSAIETLTQARQKCPKAISLFTGYSQGAALMHNAIPALAPEIRDGYTAGVLFGDTKNVQLKGTIGNWPADKLKSFCHKEDGVCWGGLSVNAGHVSYLSSGDLQSAVQWFIEKIDAALANKKEA